MGRGICLSSPTGKCGSHGAALTGLFSLQGPKGDKGSQGNFVSRYLGDLGSRGTEGQRNKLCDWRYHILTFPPNPLLSAGTARSEGEWTGGGMGGTLLIALGTIVFI